MKPNRYALAGWLSIISGALLLPEVALGFYYDIALVKNPDIATGVLPFLTTISITETILGIYAFLIFKNFLNECFEFRSTNGLIITLIILSVILTSIGTVARLVPGGIEKGLVFAPFLLGLGIPTAIVGLIFAFRLLRLNSDLKGFLKPMVYAQIGASCCFLTIILIPVAYLLLAAFSIMMGLVLLHGQEVAELEFI